MFYFKKGLYVLARSGEKQDNYLAKGMYHTTYQTGDLQSYAKADMLLCVSAFQWGLFLYARSI